LQRARRTLALASVDAHRAVEPDVAQRRVVEQWIAALVDVATLTRLVTDAVVLEMPPMRNW
jgi:hypothetical protein